MFENEARKRARTPELDEREDGRPEVADQEVDGDRADQALRTDALRLHAVHGHEAGGGRDEGERAPLAQDDELGARRERHQPLRDLVEHHDARDHGQQAAIAAQPPDGEHQQELDRDAHHVCGQLGFGEEGA